MRESTRREFETFLGLCQHLYGRLYEEGARHPGELGMTVDDELSSELALVAADETAVRVVFRGTRVPPDRHSMSMNQLVALVADVQSDVSALFAKEREDARFEQSFSLARRVREKHRDKELLVGGHSLGGALAIDVADRLDCPAFAINPIVSPLRKEHRPESLSKRTQTHIFRSYTDVASVAAGVTDQPRSRVVHHSAPRSGHGGIVDSHFLEAFSQLCEPEEGLSFVDSVKAAANDVGRFLFGRR